MAWESRKGRKYYYRSKRHNGAVVKLYFGCGAAAEAAAREDTMKCAARASQRATMQQDVLREEPSRVLLSELGSQVDGVLRAALAAAGYHQHDRGSWRKRRRRGQKSKSTEQTDSRENGKA